MACKKLGLVAGERGVRRLFCVLRAGNARAAHRGQRRQAAAAVRPLLIHKHKRETGDADTDTDCDVGDASRCERLSPGGG